MLTATEAQVLAYCRNSLDEEEIIDILLAIAADRKYDDPICVALDKCAESLRGVQELKQNAALWAADDAQCRANGGAAVGEYDRGTMAVLRGVAA
jgi:hypothetical protein